MKKNVVLISIITIMTVILFLPTYTQARGTTLNLNITDDTFVDEWKEDRTSTEVDNLTKPVTDSVVTIVNAILGVLQIIGGLLMIVSIAFFGFNRILASDEGLMHDLGITRNGAAQTNKAALDAGRRILLGTVILFTSATITRFIFNIFMK